jgi:hypothetical protein
MAVITTGSHPKALWPGVKKFFGTKYAEKPMICDQVFAWEGSDKAYEEMVEATGFGLAAIKPEGGSITYDDRNQTGVSKFTHVVYGLGFKVTREAIDDGKYLELALGSAQSLAFSMRQTKEIVCAGVLNNGFDSAYVGGDGKELFATDHPTRYGDQSNELAVAADLSEASLEALAIQIRNARNSRGLKINLTGRKLIVPPALMFEAHRIVKSNLQSGTGNNDANAMREMGIFPEGIMVHDYLTDADAFYITTDAPTGLHGFNRRGVELSNDNDFDTENACAKATMRFSVGWADWRGVYASAGAA